MKLRNNDESFEVTWDGTDFTIPEGDFEVTDDHLGYHIQNTAIKWEKDVVIISSDSSTKIKPEIKQEEKKVELKPEVEEKPKATPTTKTTTKKVTPKVTDKMKNA